MKKTLTVLSALAITASPAIALNATAHRTQNLQNILTKVSSKASTVVDNHIVTDGVSNKDFGFTVYLSNSIYNGFSGFLDQIAFKLSDYNYHAWPLLFFQWLDDDDFNHPMPGLNDHLKHGFFHWPIGFGDRLETLMSGFGSMWQDKSDTAYHMSTSYGEWGTFGQNVDNAWNAAVAKQTVAGISLDFSFHYEEPDGSGYWNDPPSFNLILNS